MDPQDYNKPKNIRHDVIMTSLWRHILTSLWWRHQILPKTKNCCNFSTKWPLKLVDPSWFMFLDALAEKTLLNCITGLKYDDISIFHLFFDIFSPHPCVRKWPPLLPTTWKYRHFFQKRSKLNQTKSPKSPGLWPGPILSSGTFYPGAGHMAPPRANRVITCVLVI